MSEKTYKYTCGYEHTISFAPDAKTLFRSFTQDFQSAFHHYETYVSEKTNRRYLSLTYILVFASQSKVVTLDYDENILRKYEMVEYGDTWDIDDIMLDSTGPRYEYEELVYNQSE